MILICEEYLAKKIEEYCAKSHSDFETFVSLTGKRNYWEYDKVDYEAFFSHVKGLIESLVLIDIYQEKFDRDRFKEAERHLRDYLREAKGILFDKLSKEK